MNAGGDWCYRRACRAAYRSGVGFSAQGARAPFATDDRMGISLQAGYRIGSFARSPGARKGRRFKSAKRPGMLAIQMAFNAGRLRTLADVEAVAVDADLIPIAHLGRALTCPQLWRIIGA